MTAEIVYVFPLNSQHYLEYALRFIASYLDSPPMIDHQTTIVFNNGSPGNDDTALFCLFPNVKFLTDCQRGYDIGAYQLAASQSNASLIAFFGASTYFKRQGWLLRMARAFQDFGNAQYGVMGNRGDARVNVQPHIRTTGFWMAPDLMRSYPVKINSPEQRHPFEHGQNCFTTWVKNRGLRNLIATWDAVYPWELWDEVPNGFHRGDQSGLLCGDRISEPPYYHCQ